MKKKILLLSDDLRTTTGIATMSKEIVLGTLDKFDWVQLSSAINHPEVGVIVDLNEDVRKETGIKDANLKLYPNNGYGDIATLRKLINFEKPDAILHFTDPHQWLWLYDNEHEIRQQVPILYYHIWDNIPDPIYNRNYYESCDWIGCISKQTYGIVHRVGKLTDKVTYKPLIDSQISYVPHGINSDLFKPIDKVSDGVYDMIHSDKKYDFILYYNNRNIRRKQPSDVINSFKLFCDKLTKEESDKCLLLMNTTPVDDNGTDLIAVKNMVCPDYSVKILNNRVEQNVLNEIYNLVDCTINIANNEGFGLSTAESVMSGTPIIVNVTGGLQDQCGFNIDGVEFTPDDYIKISTLHNRRQWGNLSHGEWVIPVWSVAHNLIGSPMTPYLYNDHVDDYEVSEAILKMYKYGRDKRKKIGLIGREWMLKNLSSKIMCDKMSEGIERTINNFKPHKKFNLYKIV